VEVLREARRDGDPNPETRQEWLDMLARFRVGDRYRLVNCVKTDNLGRTGGDYYYALIRGNEIIAKMHNVIIN
jgi:hypothetical protein